MPTGFQTGELLKHTTQHFIQIQSTGPEHILVLEGSPLSPVPFNIYKSSLTLVQIQSTGPEGILVL